MFIFLWKIKFNLLFDHSTQPQIPSCHTVFGLLKMLKNCIYIVTANRLTKIDSMYLLNSNNPKSNRLL